MRFVLKPISPTCWNITQERRKVGFVRKINAGYLARIGDLQCTAASPRAAFEDVAARAMGYKSANAVRAHNREVRAMNAVRKAEANRLINDAIRGNSNIMDVFDKLLVLVRAAER